MKPNHLVRTVGSLVLVRQGRHEANDDEYDEGIKTISHARLDSLRMLVWTDGGGPTSAQRKRLSSVIQGKPVRVAVVTDSAKVKFIVASIALFSRDVRTFSVSEMEDAYQFLKVTITERRSAQSAMEEMNRMLE